MSAVSYLVSMAGLVCFGLTVPYGVVKCGVCQAPHSLYGSTLFFLYLALSAWVGVGAVCLNDGKAQKISTAAWLASLIGVLLFKGLPPVPFLGVAVGACTAAGFVAAWLLGEKASLYGRIAVALVVLVAVGLAGFGGFTMTGIAKKEDVQKAYSLKKLKVVGLDGSEKEIDLGEKPAVFVSSACEACDEAIEETGKIGVTKRPYIIGVSFDPKNLEQDKKMLKEKVDKKAPGSEVYLTTESSFIKNLPAFVYVHGGGQVTAGERTDTVKGLLSLWDRILSENGSYPVSSGPATRR